jgi:hypothetical protein
MNEEQFFSKLGSIMTGYNVVMKASPPEDEEDKIIMEELRLLRIYELAIEFAKEYKHGG